MEQRAGDATQYTHTIEYANGAVRPCGRCQPLSLPLQVAQSTFGRYFNAPGASGQAWRARPARARRRCDAKRQRSAASCAPRTKAVSWARTIRAAAPHAPLLPSAPASPADALNCRVKSLYGVRCRGEVLNGGLNEVLKGVLNGEVLNCRVKSLRGAARSAARSLPENGARHFVRAPKHQPGRGWPHRNDGLSSVSGGRYSPTSRRVHHAGGAAPSC